MVADGQYTKILPSSRMYIDGQYTFWMRAIYKDTNHVIFAIYFDKIKPMSFICAYSLKLHVSKVCCNVGLIPVFVYVARSKTISRQKCKVYQSKNISFQIFDLIFYYLNLTCLFFVSITSTTGRQLLFSEAVKHRTLILHTQKEQMAKQMMGKKINNDNTFYIYMLFPFSIRVDKFA